MKTPKKTAAETMEILMSTPWVFPFEANLDEGTFKTTGMSLRDYYAGLAMMGLAPQWDKERSRNEIARAAVMMADALIAELAKKPVD